MDDPKNPKPTENERYEQPPDLDEDDERILDEIWDNIGEEESDEDEPNQAE